MSTVQTKRISELQSANLTNLSSTDRLIIEQSGDDIVRKVNYGDLKSKVITEVFAVANTANTIFSANMTGGTGSANSGAQYVAVTIDGITYKLLHDGTL